MTERFELRIVLLFCVHLVNDVGLYLCPSQARTIVDLAGDFLKAEAGIQVCADGVLR